MFWVKTTKISVATFRHRQLFNNIDCFVTGPLRQRQEKMRMA